MTRATNMLKQILVILSFGVALSGPALARQGAWQVTAAPVTEDGGEVVCRMTRRAGDGRIMFWSGPDLAFIGILAPALQGLDPQIEATLQIGNGPAYPLTWLGGNGGYTVNLTYTGMATVLDAMILFGDKGMLLTVGSETALEIPPDGTQDAARTMFDCRKGLPEG